MKVTCIAELHITQGREYEVHGSDEDHWHIIDDLDNPVVLPKENFAIDLKCSSYELFNGINKQNNIDPIGER